MNSVVILGTLTRNLELKYTDSGSCIGNFGIATNEKWKDAQGQMKEKAHFFDVSVFGKTAETISNYFHKGSRILIEGSLDFQSWQTQTGEKRSKVGIKLKGFTFVDRKSDAHQNNQDDPSRHNISGSMNKPAQHQAPTQAQPELPSLDVSDIPFNQIKAW